MTKKKFTAIIIACTFLFLIVSGTFLFFVEYKNNTENFSESANDLLYEMQDMVQFSDLENDDEIQYGLDNCLAHYREINAVYALVDSKGKLIAKYSPNITFDIDSAITTFKTVYLDQYMTDEIYKEIDKYATLSNIIPNKFTAHKDGDNLIPVELEFWADKIDSQSFKFKKVRFTDYEPDVMIIQDKSGLWANDFRENKGKIYDKAYDEMIKNINSFISDFEEQEINAIKSEPWNKNEWQAGYHYKKTQLFNVFEDNDITKKDHVVLYVEYSNNLAYDTFVSEEFYKPLLFMSAFFIVAGLIIGIVGSRLISKNEMLNKGRNAFVSAAAHELKTPLAVIANNCECVLENVSPEKNAEYVTTVYDESKRMSKMVKTLLEYNNLTTDGKLKKEYVDFSKVVNREIDKFRPLIESKQIELLCDIPENVKIYCDEKLMDMVVSNFISNAVKFTPEQGKIKISIIDTVGKYTFAVYNSGSEISEEDAPYIWEELYTGSKSRNRSEDSTGMGLAVSRVILKMHGFAYGFRNTGDGVTFYFDE